MKNAWRITGWYVFSLGVIHIIVGFLMFNEGWRNIWNAGLLNSLGDDISAHASFWFQFIGLMFLYLGWLWKLEINRSNEPLSKFAACGMTVMTLIGLIFVPASGFVLMVPLCIIMLYPHFFAPRKSA